MKDRPGVTVAFALEKALGPFYHVANQHPGERNFINAFAEHKYHCLQLRSTGVDASTNFFVQLVVNNTIPPIKTTRISFIGSVSEPRTEG